MGFIWWGRRSVPFLPSAAVICIMYAIRYPPPFSANVRSRTIRFALVFTQLQFFKLPMRQTTPGQPGNCFTVLSKLPMRQTTRCYTWLLFLRLSKLPMRQTTIHPNAALRFLISKLPMRQTTRKLPRRPRFRQFLNCLCGRQRILQLHWPRTAFLNCLCGRQLV